MKKIEINTTIYEYDSLDELSPDEQMLSKKAIEVVQNAYSPYSNFKVGAAVLLENGEIIVGTNQENAAYPSGLCAERVALFYANSKYPDVPVVALAVTAYTKKHYLETTTPPCGACRQVMLETENRFNKDMKILMVGQKKVSMVPNAKALLPLNFDGNFLK